MTELKDKFDIEHDLRIEDLRFRLEWAKVTAVTEAENNALALEAAHDYMRHRRKLEESWERQCVAFERVAMDLSVLRSVVEDYVDDMERARETEKKGGT